MDDLRECPFCGGEADYNQGRTAYSHSSHTSQCAKLICKCGELERQLDAYRASGLTPEQCEELAREDIPAALDRLVEYESTIPTETAREWAKAWEDGRLVVLDEPRRPLVWGDKSHGSILCPYCRNDLMGGFPEDVCIEEDIIQCFHCGRPVDGTKEPFAFDDPSGFVRDDD